MWKGPGDFRMGSGGKKKKITISSYYIIMMRKKALGKVLNTDIGQTSTWKDFKKFKLKSSVSCNVHVTSW